MKYVHFSKEPLIYKNLKNRQQSKKASAFGKPNGLWFSDEGAEESWLWWCKGEKFGLERFKFANELLIDFSNVLCLKNINDLLQFSDKYSIFDPLLEMNAIDWTSVASRYVGIMITPYQWDLRFDKKVEWYYPWDCASGCIWNKTAIHRISTMEFDIHADAQS